MNVGACMHESMASIEVEYSAEQGYMHSSTVLQSFGHRVVRHAIQLEIPGCGAGLLPS